MANQKETCLSATERVYYTQSIDTLACYHQEMTKILMDDSEYFISKAKKTKTNSNGNIEVKIKNNNAVKKTVDNAYTHILDNLKQQIFNNQPDIEPYFSHHTSQVMQLAKLGYLSALAYSPDNVFNNQSPLQKQQKKQIIGDLCKLIGFHTEEAFGHITTSHVLACYEILWALRNLKTLPMAIARHPKSRDLVADKKAFELFNMSVSDVLTLSEKLHERGIFDDVSNLTCRGTGMTRTMHLGKLLVPASRFDFWKKAMDILGLGSDNLIALPIDNTYKTDTEKTRNIVLRLIEQGEPILGVIGVLGSSLYGSIDKLKPLFKLREECENKFNSSFYIHIDASQSGYMKSLFLDENNEMIPYKTLCKKLNKEAPLLQLQPDVYDSFAQLSLANSVSFEPFQAGFSPYPTGIVCVKDARISRFLANSSKICPEPIEEIQEIDGIQSAPAVASLWSVHQLYSFNTLGYGHHVQTQWETRIKLENRFKRKNEIDQENKRYNICILPTSEFNNLSFAVVIENNKCLKTQNSLNKAIYENLVLKSHHKQDLNLLTLCPRNSDDIPAQFCLDCGLDENAWQEVKHLSLLQLTIKDTEKCGEQYIEEGYQYIKNIVLSALASTPHYDESNPV